MTSFEAFRSHNSDTLGEALSHVQAMASMQHKSSQQIDAIGASFESYHQIETSLENEQQARKVAERAAELAKSSLRLQFLSALPTAHNYAVRRQNRVLDAPASSQFEVDSLATTALLDATVLWVPLESTGSRTRWGNHDNSRDMGPTLSPTYVIGRKITSPNKDGSDALEDLLLAPAWEREPYQGLFVIPDDEKTGRPLPLRATTTMRSFDELERASSENLHSAVLSREDYNRRRVESVTPDSETDSSIISFITNGFMSHRVATRPYTTLVPKHGSSLPKLPGDEKSNILRRRNLNKIQNQVAHYGVGTRFTDFSYGEALTDQVVTDFNVEMHTRKLAELFNAQQAYDATIGSVSVHNS